MKTKISIELKPFSVPALVDEVVSPAPAAPALPCTPMHALEPRPCARSYLLSELSPDDLETLCDEFRREVFKKAGKSRPHLEPDPH